MVDEEKWNAAYAAISKEAAENPEAVVEMTKQVMFIIGDHLHLDMTLAAALFAAAVSGATVVLEAEAHPSQPNEDG